MTSFAVLAVQRQDAALAGIATEWQVAGSAIPFRSHSLPCLDRAAQPPRCELCKSSTEISVTVEYPSVGTKQTPYCPAHVGYRILALLNPTLTCGEELPVTFGLVRGGAAP